MLNICESLITPVKLSHDYYFLENLMQVNFLLTNEFYLSIINAAREHFSITLLPLLNRGIEETLQINRQGGSKGRDKDVNSICFLACDALWISFIYEKIKY